MCIRDSVIVLQSPLVALISQIDARIAPRAALVQARTSRMHVRTHIYMDAG